VRWSIVAGAVAIAFGGCSSTSSTARVPSTSSTAGISKIKHVVVIMQENRSFDSYFGTYPGADGIPAKAGAFTVCVSHYRKSRGCVKPFHDPADVNAGGPHDHNAAMSDIHNGAMDGFLRQAEFSRRPCTGIHDPLCTHGNASGVMGYHDAREIPNYWQYAHDFVLNDHMFEPVTSWSLPAHLYMVSGWSARCRTAEPASCRNIAGVHPLRLAGRLMPISRTWSSTCVSIFREYVCPVTGNTRSAKPIFFTRSETPRGTITTGALPLSRRVARTIPPLSGEPSTASLPGRQTK